MNLAKLRTIAPTALICLGLVLAACTRSANPDIVPTATTGTDIQGVAGGDQDATMAAIGTEVSNQLTQTAVAAGTLALPTATTVPVVPPGATPTPVPVGQPGATATPIPTAAGAGCSSPYTVQQGDWIYKIARTCNVQPSAIIAANPGINPNYIVPGQTLNMPAAGATAVPPATPTVCTGTHTVVRGENLFRIAYNCGLTTEQLAAANSIAFPYTIFPGQVLKFP